MKTNTLTSPASALLLLLVTQIGFADELPDPATTFNRAQTIDWISDSHMVVGRWDGTISVFREPIGATEFGPVLVQATMSPTGKGVEMIKAVAPSFLLSSNDHKSFAIWAVVDGQLQFRKSVEYPNTFGTANSAVSLSEEKNRFVVGHAGGHISVWERRGYDAVLLRSIDLRSPQEPSNPWDLRNIRALEKYSDKEVITGSEDGDVAIVNVVTQKILLRKRYNKDAQRGINALAYDGEYLLLANCSVGPADNNLWLFKVSRQAIDEIASVNLQVDTNRPQSFNFDVELWGSKGGKRFFASTEEGLLWYGTILADGLKVLDKESIALEGGAVLDIDNDVENIAAVAHAIRIFKLPE